MRERLIELIRTFCKREGVLLFNRKVLDKFADYLFEDGWIRLPCKVGDKIYFTYNEKVFNLTVEKIVIKDEGMFLVDKEFNDWYSIKKLGKTLYLTQEEAEAALKGGAE